MTAAPPARTRRPSWSGWGWSAVAVTTAFIAITFWWLTQDHTIPGTEPGVHLNETVVVYDLLRSGDLFGPLHDNAIHPPLLTLVGALAMLVDGLNAAAPIFAENSCSCRCWRSASTTSGSSPVARAWASWHSYSPSARRC